MTSDQPMRPEGGCSLPGPNGSRIPIDEPHAYSSHKGANTIFVRTCDLCGAIDWDALHEATVERVAAEVDRLRAENTALHGKLAETEAELDRFRRAEYRRLEAALAKANPVKPSRHESPGADPAALGLDQDGKEQADA